MNRGGLDHVEWPPWPRPSIFYPMTILIDCFVAEHSQQPSNRLKRTIQCHSYAGNDPSWFHQAKMLNPTQARESIYNFNDAKHHTDNHSAQYHCEWYTVAKQTNLLFHEPTMLWCSRLIQTTVGGENFCQCTDCSKFLIPIDHSDTEALMEVHAICPQESFPGIFFIMVRQMGNHGKADLLAISREEDVFFDKKMSITNMTSWWSLMSSARTSIMLCIILLLFLLTVLPFILKTECPQITLAAFTSLSVTSLPRTPPALTIALKSAVKGKIIISNKSSAQVAPAICRLLKSFTLFLIVWMNPNSPIFFG